MLIVFVFLYFAKTKKSIHILFAADRPMLRLAMDCPVLEDTLMRVLVIGLSRDIPLSPGDALDFADILVRRAANQQAEGK